MASFKSHADSLSLPSESQIATSEFDNTLSIIRSSEATSSSLSSISEKLNGHQKLYANIEYSLVLAHITQINSEEEKQILEAYIRLLDACSSAQDLVSTTKKQVQDLSSSIRRKDANGFGAYLTCRKRTKKMIEKCLKNLKSSTGIVKGESIVAVHMLKEAESVTVSVLEALLSCIMGNKSQSLISKLMNSKKVSTEVNEFKKTCAMLRTNQDDVQVVNHLKVIDSSIEVAEDSLDCLFRQLIKTRVSLLNVLNN